MGRRIRSFRKVCAVALLASSAVLLAGFETGDSAGAEAQENGSPPGTEKLSGTLSVSWVDPRPDSGLKPEVEYSLADESGTHTRLALEEGDVEVSGGPLALSGEQVEVVGVEESYGDVRVESVRPDPGASAAEEIQPAGPERGASASAGNDELLRPVSGSRPTATVLCRFADSTGTTPYPKTYFEGLMGGARPGMDHYWRELSYGKANLVGSKVVGWYNLPREKAYYTTSSGRIDTFRLAEDCTAAAEADVYFPDFSNINLMVNQAGFPSAIGNNEFPLRRDGQTRLYGVTWIPQWAYEDQVVLAHEMGHSFGLPHSGGTYGDDYDSGWDVMSDGGYRSCFTTVQYGCAGTHTIAYHKDRLGWVPRRADTSPGRERTPPST